MQIPLEDSDAHTRILKHSYAWESLLLDQTLKCIGKQMLINVIYLNSGKTMQYEVLQSKDLKLNTGIGI